MTATLFRRYARSLALISLLLSVPVVIYGHTGADSSGVGISRGFQTKDKKIVQAALVSATSGSTDVELATLKNSNRLAGVVTKASLLELSDNKKGAVQVALSGAAIALVSDINGSIRAGDKITISPINGIGMLAASDSQIVGTAATSFNVKDAKTEAITDKSGKRHTVHIGSIPIQVSVAYYVAPTNKLLPPFLQSLANSVAGRPVSATRILFGSVLLLFAFISIFALIYTSVRAGLISLGRNPLAANAIQRGLVGVGITTLLVLVFTLLATYLILIY